MNNEELGRLIMELLNETSAPVVLNWYDETELICGLVDSDVRIIPITKITGVHSSRAGKGIRTPDIMLGKHTFYEDDQESE